MSQTADLPTTHSSPAPERDQTATGPGTELKRPGLVLLLLCVAEFMIVLDFSITNVALPDIQSSLGFSSSALQWVVSSYALAFGGFLMLGGRLGDLFGRKIVFQVSAVVFVVGSIVSGAANGMMLLIIGPAVQGIG
ncbi:MFS transporter, partial [Kitasatospora nipponensis]|uniref:MFS transporter n=1 Tax=Kitasatospora nipponensis TaxID=258049 RepID=UPI0031E34F4E